MNKTKIEWVKNPDGTQGYTWNPITGCLNHTPEGLCLGGMFPCYAYRLAHGRLKERYLHGGEFSTSISYHDRYPGCVLDPFYPRFWEDRLYQLDSPRLWETKHKPKGIFVCDMSDLFGIGIPEEWTRRILDYIRRCPNDRFYLLTKQPQYLPQWSPFPDNCWVGVTATNPEMTKRACYYLRDIEATVKFISFEPLLSDVAHIFFPEYIDWVIIGAQTKPYKPPKIEWVEEIVRACDKARIPVFCKDNLEPILHQLPQSCVAWTGWGEQTRRKLRQEFPG